MGGMLLSGISGVPSSLPSQGRAIEMGGHPSYIRRRGHMPARHLSAHLQ